MFESKYSKVLTIILIVVIIAIVILLGFLGYDYYEKYFVTKQASDFVDNYQGEDITSENKNEEAQNNISTEENVTLNGLDETPTAGVSNNSTATKKKYEGFTVCGTMTIPAINFEYPILEESSKQAIEKAVSLLYPSPENLNKPGNVVIVGHNYRNGLFFSNLKKLSNGDKIHVVDYTGKRLTYEVYNKFETLESDTSFYARDTNGKAELTLSTCTDASNDQRTIIFAREI